MSWIWLAGICMVAMPWASFQSTATARVEREPRYNPATVVNVQGFVVDIRENTDFGSLRGLYLVLKTDTDRIDVYLGPPEFIRRFEITFKSGDNLQLAGSKVKDGSSWLVLAREVRRDSSTLYLRDKEGRPYWEDTGST
jgi:hypothetical protein